MSVCYERLREAFEQRLLRERNRIKIRVLTRKLYDATDKILEGHKEFDEVVGEVRRMQDRRRKRT